MSYTEQQSLEASYMMCTYGRKPVEFIRGEGIKLFDSEGKEYYDFLSGIGAVCLGHANPRVSDALALQASKLMQVGNHFYIEGRGEYARDLSLFLNDGDAEAASWKTFFANSGAEANEGAIKLARKYGKLHLEGAGTVLTASGSFHGRTLMTTAATGQEAKQAVFAPMPSGIEHFVPGDIEDFTAALARCKEEAVRTGIPELMPVAVLLECVQGESGVWPLSNGYLQEVRAITEEHGMLLMIDEVQTGFCRTGKNFAFMHAGIKPDVVAMAKGIANGFPCGAVAATGTAADIFEPGEHGSTFGGNPMAIAAARATLRELQLLLVSKYAAKMGDYLKASLKQLPFVTDVRGSGLMQGMTLSKAIAPQVLDAALERGMVFNAIGDTILRFLPPLIVTEAEVDALCIVLQELLEEL